MRLIALILGVGAAAAGAVVLGVVAIGGGSSTANALALRPFGAIPPAKVDQDHDGLDDNFEQRIAEKYAPVLFFEAQEKTYPASVAWLLGRMQLQHREDGCAPDHTSTLKSESGPILDHLLGGADHPWTFPDDFSDVGPRLNCQDSKRTSLSTIDSLPDGPDGNGVGDEQNMQLAFTNGGPDDATKAGELDPSQWATYVHVYPSAQHGVIIQYWHAFPYNPVPADTHEGDWDASLQVRLDAQLNLVGAWFSRHSNDAPGRWIPASQLSVFHGTHIDEAIDSGGHGAYASPQDWCAHPDTVHAGVEPHLSIVWPGDTSNPTADTLHHQNCSLVGVPGSLNKADTAGGGTVWQTWTGGRVTQRGDNLAQPLDNQASAGGPLINVGECNLGHQAAQLDQGHCYPLNGQTFIEYSGQWGTTRSGDLFFGPTSPRGPLYQGYDKDSQTYKSFYNDGANAAYQPEYVEVKPGNGTVDVSWQPPADAHLVTGYDVRAVPFYNDRVPAPQASPVAPSSPIGPGARSAHLQGFLADCHQRYLVTVTAKGGGSVGPAATSSFRPSGVVADGSDPPYVVILLDGVNESQPGFAMNPYKPTLDGNPSYCPEAWNASSGSEAEADFAGAPNGPWSFFHKWNFGEVKGGGKAVGPNDKGYDESAPRAVAYPKPPPNIAAGTYTHNFMLDAIASRGAIILPFSYKGYGFAPNFQAQPGFSYDGYSGCQATPGCGPTIQDDAKLLDGEVNAAASVWPTSKIVVMGHSQGGLIAFEWWACSHNALPQTAAKDCGGTTTTLPPNFVAGVSLDSPINGACGQALGHGPCFGPPSYPDYGQLTARDPAYVSLDAPGGQSFYFIGTYGDSPIGGYQSGAKTLVHQLLFTQPDVSAIDSACGNPLNESGCPAASPDHISDCPVEGVPNLPDWEKNAAHYVEKFCPGDIAYFNETLGLTLTRATQSTMVKTFEPWVAVGQNGGFAPSPSLIVTKGGTATCDEGSADDYGSALAVRCIPPGNATPCFIYGRGGDLGSPVLCSSDPTSKQVIEVTPAGANGIPAGMLNRDDPSQPPWFLILADGRKCRANGYGTDTNILTYDCGGTVGATVPDRSQPTWTVREGVFQGNNPTLSSTRVAVVTAYR